ncbi:MAG: DeoR family transcriptional regulator [Desulfobacterales bacterium]
MKKGTEGIDATHQKNGKFKGIVRRQEQVLHMVREQGFVTIEALAARFRVTPQTIRRDINTLSEDGLLHRYHGGAGISSSTENVSYSHRKIMCLQEKRKIARMLVDTIPDHSSLFINIGTTTEEIAKALCNHNGLRIITNNLNVASILSGNENFEIIITGGLVRSRDCGIIGEAAIEFIKQFKVDYGIIGISGIDIDGTLLDFDYREVKAARAMIENSRNVFLAADHTKFGRNAMVRLGYLSEITALFTDRPPSSAIVDVIAEAGLKLYVATE